MKKYTVDSFKQSTIQDTINKIKQSRSKWSLDLSKFENFLEELPKLIQKGDLSEIITDVDYQNTNNIPVFNAVITYAQLAKWTENALEDEKQGKNADDQWKAIWAVLEHAQEKGVEYCSLIRGWDPNKFNEVTDTYGVGAAQGDQILKLLKENLQATKNHPIKSKIFSLILEEVIKGDDGLYAIPQNYKINDNVKYAAEEHKKFVNSDEFSKLGDKWISMELTEESKISRNDFAPPEGMPKELNLYDINPDHFDALINQAKLLADKASSTPENFVKWIHNAKIILDNTLSAQQPSTSSNMASSSKVEFNFNKINELIKNYKIVTSEEYVNRVLETEDEEIIEQALNKPDFIKAELNKMVKELTKELPKYYENLSSIKKSLFKGTEVCSEYNELAKNIRSVDTNLSDDLRYPLCKIMLKAPKNPFEVIGEASGGELEGEATQTLKTFVQQYEVNHPNDILDLLGRQNLVSDLDLD